MKNEVYQSLIGLAVGDAYGENYLRILPPDIIEIQRKAGNTELRGDEYPWTDDTAMAIGIVECLNRHGKIVQANDNLL